MSIKKKVLSSAMALVMACSGFAYAAELPSTSHIANKVLDEVTSLYTEYYTISNAEAYVSDTAFDEEGNATIAVSTSFDRTLKASSADELPYVQGLQTALEELTDEADIMVAQQYIDSVKAELENLYIGQAQSTEADFMVTVNASELYARDGETSVDISNISYVGMEEAVPASQLEPASPSELQENGEEALISVLENASETETFSLRAGPITSYDRVAARDYARKWSCTGGYLYDHASCHNPSYSFYDSNDCTNFVSQALYAGGLPTDSTWYKDSTTWISANSLRNYLTSNNLFFQSTNENKAFAGSIINWVDSSGASTGHVGLVDQNDTVTMTFCAHTRCRNSCPWDGEPVDFYIPLWDSYSGSWTQQ